MILLLALGCNPRGGFAIPDADTDTAVPQTGDTGTTSIVPTGTPPDPTGSTGETAGATGSTGDTGEPDPGLDCTLPPPIPTATLLTGMPVSEEFAFDDQGNLVNVDDTLEILLRTPYGGPPSVVGPYNAVELAGVGILEDGSYVVAEEWEGALTITTTLGARTTLLSGLNQPNSVAIGIDGLIYATAFDEVLRVDPVSGTRETLAIVPNADLDGLVFNPAFTELYVNHDEVGEVAKIVFDSSGAVASFAPVANLSVTWSSELDGMAMDACENLYVVRTDGLIYRVAPDGTVVTYLTLPGGGGLFTSSLHFGSGVGGWADDHLYVMDRSAGVWEVTVGIPGAVMAHLLP